MLCKVNKLQQPLSRKSFTTLTNWEWWHCTWKILINGRLSFDNILIYENNYIETNCAGTFLFQKSPSFLSTKGEGGYLSFVASSSSSPSLFSISMKNIFLSAKQARSIIIATDEHRWEKYKIHSSHSSYLFFN